MYLSIRCIKNSFNHQNIHTSIKKTKCLITISHNKFIKCYVENDTCTYTVARKVGGELNVVVWQSICTCATTKLKSIIFAYMVA